MVQTVITFVWTKYAMESILPKDSDALHTITVDAEFGMRTMEMMPHWIDAGFVETFRAESLLPLT